MRINVKIFRVEYRGQGIYVYIKTSKVVGMRCTHVENNTWVRGNTGFVSSVEYDVSAANEWEISGRTREINLVFQAPMYFSAGFLCTRRSVLSYLKCEAQPSVLDMIKREFKCIK